MDALPSLYGEDLEALGFLDEMSMFQEHVCFARIYSTNGGIYRSVSGYKHRVQDGIAMLAAGDKWLFRLQLQCVT